MAQERVTLQQEGHIAVLALARPEKLNAIDPLMLQGIEAVVQKLEQDTEVRAVLLTGAGDRAFSVGADIHAWAALEPMDMWRHWIREGHRVLGRLARLRMPLIAVINGYAFGGGLELALVADWRIAAETAVFSMPEVTIATVPGWGGTTRLPALIGPARAKEMILGGLRIDAKKAERWGLINDVFPREALLQEAMVRAATIAEHAPLAVQMAKQLIDGRSATASETLEALAGALAAHTADGREGIASFRERRRAQYEGR